MLLRRQGSKGVIAKDVQAYFPKHKAYIEPFFGAGGMFFNKPQAQYNLLNDLDDEVYSLFKVLLDKELSLELERQLEGLPVHSRVFEEFKENRETDIVKKAVRLVYLSNYGFLSDSSSFNSKPVDNSKQIILLNLKRTKERLKFCKFFNWDFRKFIKALSFRRGQDESQSFIYCDPPYVETGQRMYPGAFKEQDFIDLLDCLVEKGVKFAISEKANLIADREAKARNLNIIKVCRCAAPTGHREEILITNYDTFQLSLFK